MHGDELYNNDGRPLPEKEVNVNVMRQHPGLSDPIRNVKDMTEREMLEEIVMTMRTVGAALGTFQQLGPMGMMKVFMTGGK